MAMSADNVESYWRPHVPCDYCRVWQLDCIVHHSQRQSCYPCVILSRQCNLDIASAISASQPALEVDTRNHRLPSDLDDGPQIREKTRSRRRLSSHQANILEDWAQSNKEHPYPTETEKTLLQQLTDLSRTQVCNWFTNHRRKRKAALQNEPASQNMLHQQIQPIRIRGSKQAWETLDPLQRWRQSPPEAEPATLDDISSALLTANILYGSGSEDIASRQHSYSGSNPETRSPWMSSPSFGEFFDNAVPSVASTESLESGLSVDSCSSHRSSRSSGRTGLRSGTPRYRHRNRRKPQYNVENLADRRFQCTFCTDRFKTKFDWVRHEKTLHLSLETWTCPGASAEEVRKLASSSQLCAFCDSSDTSMVHYALHKPTACAPVFDNPSSRRIFSRKDHLRQHLRVAHNVHDISNTIQQHWRSEMINLRSRCGFCNATFTRWDERVNHLVQEFHNGAEMKNWRGPRGFSADVEARATFSMPPYLIDVDAKTQTPFSASDPLSILHHATLFPEQRRSNCLSVEAEASWKGHIESPFGHSGIVTYWEKFDAALGQWVRARMQEGMEITDEMIQEQGRFIVFGTTDPWNQSEADHPDWLAEFKVKHGIQEKQPDAIELPTSDLCTEFQTFDIDVGPRFGEAHILDTSKSNTASESLDSFEAQMANFLHMLERSRSP